MKEANIIEFGKIMRIYTTYSYPGFKPNIHGVCILNYNEIAISSGFYSYVYQFPNVRLCL